MEGLSIVHSIGRGERVNAIWLEGVATRHGRWLCVGSVIAENEERRHLVASIQRPIDGLPYLIIISSMSM